MPLAIGLARSISVGGLLGTLIAYLVCLRYPQVITDTVGIKEILFFGSALGTSIHRSLSNLIGKAIVKPIYDWGAYTALCEQLEYQRRSGRMSEVHFNRIKTCLDYQYFLGQQIDKTSVAVEDPQEVRPGKPENPARRKPIVKRHTVVEPITVSSPAHSTGD